MTGVELERGAQARQLAPGGSAGRSGRPRRRRRGCARRCGSPARLAAVKWPAAGLGDDQVERHVGRVHGHGSRPPGRRSRSRRARPPDGRDGGEGQVVEAGAVAEPAPLPVEGQQRRQHDLGQHRRQVRAGSSTRRDRADQRQLGAPGVEGQRPAPPCIRGRSGSAPSQCSACSRGRVSSSSPSGQNSATRAARARAAPTAQPGRGQRWRRRACAASAPPARTQLLAEPRLRSAIAGRHRLRLVGAQKGVTAPPKPFRRGRPWDLLRRWAPCDVATTTTGTAPVGTN